MKYIRTKKMKTKIRNKIRIVCLLCTMLCVLTSCAASSKIKPVQLTCEYMTNPSVVDVVSPRLAWINEVVSDKVRGEFQQAYRICVASSKAKLLKGEADIWDSGKVPSRDSYLIPFAGSKLQSGKDYWWRVMVWDSNDLASSWSAPAHWGMGILSPDEWKAKWIGAPWQGEAPRKQIGKLSAAELVNSLQKGYPVYPAPLLRKSFQLRDRVVSAKAFVTGLGFFEFYMNGKKVGNDCLIPNFTNYTFREDITHDQLWITIDNNFRGNRVMYLAYDITGCCKNR